MGCMVVFYSNDGNTRLAAEELAKQKDAKLFELKEKKGKRKGFFGFMSSGFGASTKKKSALINHYSEETKKFDTVYIGSPVWAGNSSPAVNTYVHHADFAGKKVYLFFYLRKPGKRLYAAGRSRSFKRHDKEKRRKAYASSCI